MFPAPVPPGPVLTGVEMGRGAGGWAGENEVPVMQTCRCPGRSRRCALAEARGAWDTRSLWATGKKDGQVSQHIKIFLC